MLSLRQASRAGVAVCINRETEGVVYADRRGGKRELIAYKRVKTDRKEHLLIACRKSALLGPFSLRAPHNTL